MSADLSRATPRPWRYDQFSATLESDVILESGKTDVICTFDAADAPDDEIDANGWLIVAAVNAYDPSRDDTAAELRAALRQCLDALDDHGEHPGGGSDPECVECRAKERARAALAKVSPLPGNEGGER